MSIRRTAISAAYLLVCACGSVAPAAAPAPVPPAAATLPGGTAARHLGALLDAINTGDSAAIGRMAAERYGRGYLEASAGVPGAQQRWLEIHALYGPLVVDTVVAASELEIRAWVRGRVTGGWLDFLVFADSAPPHGIARVRLGRGIRPPHASLRRPALDEAGLRRHLEGYLRRMADAGHFSGTVLVSRHGRTVFRGAYGMADREQEIPNRPGTRFDLASVGKVFTAVAVGQLADEGRLSLDDPVSRYVPELPLAERITIRQLLEHSSGLGEMGPALDSAMAKSRTVGEMLALLHDSVPAFPPGTRFQYSNRGYIVLGAVIERASGMDYFQYLQERVFAPAGMRGTGFFAEDEPVPDRARRYSFYPGLRTGFRPGPRTLSTVRHDVRGGPAGGAFSTVDDLARFADALRDGRLIRPETFAVLLERRADSPYGLGFEVEDAPARAYGHRGAAPGATAHLRVYPDAGYTVVVLSNFDAAAGLVGDYIRDLIVP